MRTFFLLALLALVCASAVSATYRGDDTPGVEDEHDRTPCNCHFMFDGMEVGKDTNACWAPAGVFAGTSLTVVVNKNDETPAPPTSGRALRSRFTSKRAFRPMTYGSCDFSLTVNGAAVTDAGKYTLVEGENTFVITVLEDKSTGKCMPWTITCPAAAAPRTETPLPTAAPEVTPAPGGNSTAAAGGQAGDPTNSAVVIDDGDGEQNPDLVIDGDGDDDRNSASTASVSVIALALAALVSLLA